MDSLSPFAPHFGTNYVPPTSEIQAINKLIDARQVVVNGIDEEIADLDRRRKVLADKKQTHLDYIDKHRELISPTRRLHPDILTAIFLQLVSTFSPCGHYLRPPVMNLSHVCRQWRDVTIASPLLWSYINLYVISYPKKRSTDDEGYSSRLTKWRKGMEGLCTMAGVFVDRSQGCPLQVYFSAEDPDSESYADAISDEAGWARATDPIQTIIEKGVNDWKSLKIGITMASPQSLLMSVLGLPTVKCKALESLELDIDYKGINGSTQNRMWHTNCGGKIDVLDAPLTSLNLVASFEDICRVNARWDDLTVLTIGSSHAHGLSAQEAIDVLSITPNLVQCTITFSPDAPQTVSTQQPVNLPKLQELTVHGSAPSIELISLLNTPSLLRLSATYNARSPQGENRSPLVEWVRRYGNQLSCATFIYHTLTQSALTYVLERLPNVESLELRWKAENNISIDLSLGSNAPSPREKPKETILDPLILQALTPAARDESSAEPGGECMCPKLQTLVCKLGEGHSERTKELVARMVEARRRLGKKGGPIALLDKADVTFYVGPVEAMLDELRARGVDTTGISFKAKYADSLSTPCLYQLPIPGLGTIKISMDHSHNPHGHHDGHSH
ncbi:hypothetical protein NMY22_g15203 [Coprinellus aureogranulatus]|nr:hypothetical protein NMY22_g15203 [Coprinellus aureogranulatus]